MVFHIQGVEIGDVGDAVVSKAVATEFLGIGVEYNIVGACGNEEAVVGVRTRWREVEDEYQVAALEAQYLIAIIVPYLLHRSVLEVTHALDDLEHLTVEIAQPMVAEVLIVNQVPLATGILIRPAITLAWEVDPLGMTELVAHEVQITTVDGSCRHQTNHLVQGDASLCHIVDILLREMPIHIGVDETEDDGLVAHQCLVVTLAV